MLGDDPTVLTDHDAVGIGVNIDRPSDRARRHRVFVVVEAHQAGLRDRRWYGVESVEPAGIGNEPRTLGLEHFPDRPVRELRMAMCLVGNGTVPTSCCPSVPRVSECRIGLAVADRNIMRAMISLSCFGPYEPSH